MNESAIVNEDEAEKVCPLAMIGNQIMSSTSLYCEKDCRLFVNGECKLCLLIDCLMKPTFKTKEKRKND